MENDTEERLSECEREITELKEIIAKLKILLKITNDALNEVD